MASAAARTFASSTLVAQQFQLYGAEYRSIAATNLEWRYALNQKTSVTTTLQYTTLEYPDFPVKDADLVSLILGYRQVFSGSMLLTISLTMAFTSTGL